MNYQKKFIKYKQKYLCLKNQHGGSLFSDITHARDNIEELNKHSIPIPKEIIDKLTQELCNVNNFYYKTIGKEIQQQDQNKNKREIYELPFIIVKILWINFFKNFCDIITEFHTSIMNSADKSEEIRKNDINEKLQSLNDLLLSEWIYFLPPSLEDIKLSDSKLTKPMLFSETFAYNSNKPIQKPPQFGFIHPPKFIRKTIIHYNPDTMDDRIKLINEESEKNEILLDVLSLGSWEDYDIHDIKKIIEELFRNKKYSDLELFFKQNEIDFINLHIDEYSGGKINYNKLL
jgi:hypothetical protein